MTPALLTALSLLTACGGGSGDSNIPEDTVTQSDDANPFEPVPPTTDEPASEPIAPLVTPVEAEPVPEPEPDPVVVSDPVLISEPDVPPQNEGEELVVVTDPNDAECTGLINLALDLYGEPTDRVNSASIDGGPIDTAVIEWAGIETTVLFEINQEFDGCRASYIFGGPAIQVPAIVAPIVTPEPEPEPAPIPVIEPEPVIQPEPDPIPVIEPEPVMQPEPEPIPVIEPEPVTQPEPEPIPVIEPDPEPPFMDRNCDEFATQAEAQQFFEAEEAQFPGDRHVLDIDNDGVACEPFFRPEPEPEPAT